MSLHQKRLSNRQIANRVKKALTPVNTLIFKERPRPREYDFRLGWGIAFDVEKSGTVLLTVWTVTPAMLKKVPVELRLTELPWTELGEKVLDSLKDVIEAECGVKCRVTYMMGLWENTFGEGKNG